MRALDVATRGKGTASALRRAGVIGARYGLTSKRMQRCLDTMLDLVDEYDCRATVPVTAVAVERNPESLHPYVEAGVEFAVHGLYHVDHAGLSARDQIEQLGRARDAIAASGATVTGFRAPYLRLNDGTLAALRTHGFVYDASPSISWPVSREVGNDAYQRVLRFYGSVPATERLAVPWLQDDLVRVPYCLPDDEAVVDRLHLSGRAISDLWLEIFDAMYRSGELLVLGVHPERIWPCSYALRSVLERARSARPPVWVARLDEIATWWRQRAAAVVDVSSGADGWTRLRLSGPPGLALLARGVDIAGAEPWADGWAVARRSEIELSASRRPFIGAHRSVPENVVGLLADLGYIVERADSGNRHSYYLDAQAGSSLNARMVVSEIETGGFPLVKVAAWPRGSRSALAVTGDLDALTIYDYALRFVGR